jgi:hypothetical protein
MYYGLDCRGIGFRFQEEILLHSVLTGSGDHPVFYVMGTGVIFHGDKTTGASN